MPNTKPGIVYALVDPRSERVKYIGQTTRNTKARLSDHLSSSNLLENTPKNAWLRELLNEGLKPITIILQECAGWELVDAENRWIEIFRHQPEGLTNRYQRYDPRGTEIRKTFSTPKPLRGKVNENRLLKEQKQKESLRKYFSRKAS